MPARRRLLDAGASTDGCRRRSVSAGVGSSCLAGTSRRRPSPGSSLRPEARPSEGTAAVPQSAPGHQGSPGDVAGSAMSRRGPLRRLLLVRQDRPESRGLLRMLLHARPGHRVLRPATGLTTPHAACIVAS